MPSQPPEEPQWPPKSPRDVLMSTPGGRERLRRLAGRTSPSPTSKRMSRITASGMSSRTNTAAMDLDDDDEEEDEEMLQLKLQEIQAKLKLKKLQNARAVTAASSSGSSRPASAADSISSLQPARRIVPAATAAAAARSQSAVVEVPASPTKRAPAPQKSPLKVQLGIDKGLRAKDMSLKRAASVISRRSGHDDAAGVSPASPPRPLSFNERMAVKRNEEAAQAEKQQRLQKLRSSAFALKRDEMESYKATAEELPEFPEKPQVYTRAEILGVENKRPTEGARSASGGYLKRSNTAPGIREGGQGTGPSEADSTKAEKPGSSEDASFESYSGVHLKKRIIPHHVLTRSISGKKVYVLKDLLRHVKAPDWCLPDDECDIVVFAILASKSDPRSHKPRMDGDGKERPNDRGKFMVMTLVDLEYEVELFLFNQGFDRFWKLTPGTVLAILNPNIMAPPRDRQAAGKFSLVINSDDDCVLEVGTARDLGFCQSTRRDGTLCPAWVNAKRTEHCEFHSNEAITKARAGRMELNGAGFGKFGTGNGEKRRVLEHTAARHGGPAGPKNYDRETHSRVFVNRGSASLMDRDGDYLESLERKEAAKRRLLAREKERELAKKLGSIGGGAGKEYMQRRAAAAGGSTGSGVSSSSEQQKQPTTSAGALDLLARARNPPKIDLGPAKRKRPDSATSNSTAGGGSLGWGSALKDRLGKMKEAVSTAAAPLVPADQPRITTAFGASSLSASSSAGSLGKGDRSPVRKKTRFVTEKGIREAGRESLGAELAAADGVGGAGAAGKMRRVVVVENVGDDDDDELVIV